MTRANPLIERFLPEIVDRLGDAAAIARAAEVQGAGPALELLLEQLAYLQATVTLLRVIDYACRKPGAGMRQKRRPLQPPTGRIP